MTVSSCWHTIGLLVIQAKSLTYNRLMLPTEETRCSNGGSQQAFCCRQNMKSWISSSSLGQGLMVIYKHEIRAMIPKIVMMFVRHRPKNATTSLFFHMPTFATRNKKSIDRSRANAAWQTDIPLPCSIREAWAFFPSSTLGCVTQGK
jgi:hypothetical protein